MLGRPRGPRVDILAEGRQHELNFRYDLPTHQEELFSPHRSRRSSFQGHSISSIGELPLRSVTEDGVA